MFACVEKIIDLLLKKLYNIFCFVLYIACKFWLDTLQGDSAMGKIEERARAAHGDTSYDLTWRARSEQDLLKKKRLWTFVALESGARYLLVIPSVCIILYISFGYMMFKIEPSFHLLFSLIPTLILFELIACRSQVMARVSTFYAIAADYKRHGLDGIDRKKFLLFGGISFVLARLVWLFWGRRLHNLSITDLDVLGSVFSKTRRWEVARKIFHEIQNRYLARNQSGDRLQTAVSFALVCKWMLDEVGASPTDISIRKIMIRDVVRTHPNLPPEVTIRLYEALEEEQEMKNAQEEIAKRYA